MIGIVISWLSETTLQVLFIVFAFLFVVTFLLLLNCRKKRKISSADLFEAYLIKDMMGAFPQSMFLLDANKVVVGIYNVTPAAMAGYLREDIVGKHIYLFSKDPESPFYQVCSMLDSAFDQIKLTGQPCHFEYMIGEAHLDALISEVGDGRVLSQVRDVSDIVRERQETERMRQAELSVAMTAGGITSWRYDVRSGKLNSAHNNPIVGQELELEKLIERIQPPYQDQIRLMYHRIINEGAKHEELISQVRDLLGNLRWTKVNAVPYEFDSDGKVMVIFGSQQDITQAYETEKEAEWNRLKLQLSIRSGGMVQWEYNAREQTFMIEDRLYVREEMRSLIHPEDYETFQYECEQVLSGRQEHSRTHIRMLGGESAYRYFKVNAVVSERDECGLPLSVTGLLSDVTESVQMTNELIELRDKAEESNRLKSAFLANMSHEIRTPLNAIVGFSGLLLETEDKEEIAEYQQIINQNNHLLLTLIDDILDLSKIESGRIAFSFSSIDVPTLLSQLQQTTQMKARSGVTVCLDKVDRDIVLTSDIARLTQVIANFLNNAVKFTASGEIAIGCQTVEEGYRFYVRDTGTGISEKNIKTVFDRFVKFDPNVPGTGLGLSICSTIISLLGGTIGAESELGKGSTFWFILPKQSPLEA